MKQNEFERHVKAQMDELDLSPSDEVWIEVERRIRKEKKRRFIFWWPLFALLLAGGAGMYFFVNNNSDTNDTNTKRISANTPNKTEEKKKAEPGVSSKINSVKQQEVVNDKPAQLINENGGYNPVLYDKRIAFKPVVEKTNVSIEKSKSTTKQLQQEKKLLLTINSFLKSEENETRQAILPASVTKGKISVVENAVQQTSSDKNSVEIKQINEITSLVTATAAHTDSIKRSVQFVSATEKQDSAVVAVVPDNTIKLTKKNNWRWGGSILVGTSALADRFGILEKLATFDAAIINTPIANFGSSANSTTKRGATFTGSLFIQKQIKSKSVLRFAVSYDYLSWSFNVGNRVDSAFAPGSISTGAGVFTNGYYRAASGSGGSRYTNSYHLLGASAEFSLKLMQGKKLNLYWDNSISYKRLISSNMLHYNSTFSGYYQNNDLLQKDQLFFSTAFLLHTNTRFSIGPYVQYGITPVLKKEQSPRRHFSSFGIRTAFLFGK
jgi:hypothetical protein